MAKFFTYQYSERRPPKDSGLNTSYWLHHRSLARATDKNPYLLINEWICSNIGWYLRLPIPPFALMRKGGSARFFASLDYGKPESQPEDMDPASLAREMAYEATGVVVFDALIANPDRHEQNIQVDNAQKPTRIEVFDHDTALLGHNKNHGVYRLRNIGDRLGYSKGLQDYDNFHHVAKSLTTAEHFWPWCSRVSAIPHSFITSICDEATSFGALKEEATMAAEFLRYRSQDIWKIIGKNKRFFKSIKDWGLFPNE